MRFPIEINVFLWQSRDIELRGYLIYVTTLNRTPDFLHRAPESLNKAPGSLNRTPERMRL